MNPQRDAAASPTSKDPYYIRGGAAGGSMAQNLSAGIDNSHEKISEITSGLFRSVKFDEACAVLRGGLREIGKQVLTLKNHPALQGDQDGVEADPERDRGEMIANVTLAFRHIEDAIMRLGKAIQAYDGGKSVYQR